MSLLDALLQDAYGDPRDIWIALRSDGLKGSGTASDPYDGGAPSGPPISASLVLDRTEVIFAAGSPHGYTPGQTGVSVVISGVTGPDQNLFNQPFTIEVLTYNDFKINLTGVPTVPPFATDVIRYRDTSLPDTDANKRAARLFWPVVKVTTAVNHGYVDFDAVSVSGVTDPAFSALNGTFVVVGAKEDPIQDNIFRYRLTSMNSMAAVPSADGSFGGCSCSKLIHRFDEVMRSAPANSIIRLGPGTFQTRGLCSLYARNFNAHPADLFVGWQVKAGQKFLGSGIGATTLKLVYAVDTLTLTQLIGIYPSAFSASGFEASNFTVDGNLSGQPIPAAMAFAPVTVGGINVAGSHIRIRRVRAINLGPQSIPESFGLSIVADATGQPGPINVNNVIEDCIVERPSENNTHETTTIGIAGGINADGMASVVRHCFVNCQYSGGISSEAVAIATISGVSTDGKYTLTTKRKHNRMANNNVVLNRVSIAGIDPAVLHPFLNGSFTIISWISATELQCQRPTPPSSWPAADYSKAYIGVDFHGPAVASGAGCVTEGNSTYDSVNNFYIDTGATRSAVLRYNYYSNIGYGINQNFPPDTAFETPPRIADDAPAPAPLPLTHVGTLATFRAKAPHGLFVGEAVKIANARISGQLADTTYNGNFLVETVDPSDAKVFSYRMNMAPSLDADRPTGAQPIQFAARWQTHRWAIENNIFDVYATDINSAAAPRGMSTYGYEGVPPYMFRHLVFRENIVRHLDSVPSTPSAVEGATVGLRIDSVDGALIQENIIDVEDPNPIQYLHSQNVKSFNNATAAGVLIRGHLSTSPETNQKDDDWATVIEDAMVLSL